jgi:hypothetical protein
MTWTIVHDEACRIMEKRYPLCYEEDPDVAEKQWEECFNEAVRRLDAACEGAPAVERQRCFGHMEYGGE